MKLGEAVHRKAETSKKVSDELQMELKTERSKTKRPQPSFERDPESGVLPFHNFAVRNTFKGKR